jgi:hypothetical protein
MDINEFLNKWKAESLFGERQFEKLDYTRIVGESLYLLSYKTEVSVDGVKKSIFKGEFFQTLVQGLPEIDTVDPNSDIYRCQTILSHLEADFFKDYNDFIDGEARKITSP